MSDRQPISEIIRTALENIKDVVDTGTIIGEPINILDGTTILPVSRISVGIASGGAEYGTKEKLPSSTAHFGGGGGTGLTVSPVAFLVITAQGEVRLLQVDGPSGYPAGSVAGAVAAVDEIIDKAPDIIAKIKDIFKKKPEQTEDEIS